METIGGESRDAQGVAEFVQSASQRRSLMMSQPVAPLGGNQKYGGAGGPFCDCIYARANCLRSVERAAAAAKDFDPFDVVRGQMGKVELSQSHAVYFYSVDEHEDLVTIRAANEYAGSRSTRPGLDYIHARNISHGLDH